MANLHPYSKGLLQDVVDPFLFRPQWLILRRLHFYEAGLSLSVLLPPYKEIRPSCMENPITKPFSIRREIPFGLAPIPLDHKGSIGSVLESELHLSPICLSLCRTNQSLINGFVLGTLALCHGTPLIPGAIR